MAFEFADVVLNRRGIERWRTGHPWVFRAGVARLEESTGAEALVRVRDGAGRVLGHALVSRESQITLRKISEGAAEPGDAWILERIRAADAYRRRRLPERDAYRAVYGESDGLPGLVVDRYGDHLVVQLLSWGMDALREPVLDALRAHFAPASILGRNDPGVRALEGLPRAVEVLHGEPPGAVPYHEGTNAFLADLRGGQKTGTFLDQVENHLAAGALAQGRVLDAFTYNGGFALAAAARAREVVAVDVSGDALASARANAERNGIRNVSFVEANVFDLLRQEDREDRAYDMVVLDPPAFAKNKRELEGALRGYKEINIRSMKILAPGGILVTCSCSYHLSDEMMDEMLAHAAADARRTFRLVERRPQASDHPVRVGFPESSYLKCRILERVE